MGLTKLGKRSSIWMPWIFGMVLVVTGIIVNQANPERLHGIILISSGLICMSLYCVCVLLGNLIEK